MKKLVLSLILGIFLLGIVSACHCGDGILQTWRGEECDDGNQNNYDACRNDCTLPYCGDGILDPGEECDDGNNIDGDNCSANCTIEVPIVPEFGKFAFILTALGAVTIFFVVRRK